MDTENGKASPPAAVSGVRLPGVKRQRRRLEELACIVRPAGLADAVRAFAHDERDQAQQYADEFGAEVEELAGDDEGVTQKRG